ncbi:sporulation protein YtfJ [Caldalkalibacillus thermarum TA2.A1]|uniref:GerW family sporulation protein n=1 Tax=Caldalkalibacillus thermarum (strain TA2.A1) TaxID=986075 RepID=F5L673_CALTT|nr:GerW family sporulation protein [Caldalkalibacillus thermarum]EGL83173.1 sporulation protein YtfJ [Caldalkalibacillus thermarum TA2.A1]QZT35100.1 GerW family sporulation protein [Caldalkalibacillus thermarum TA2.A1]
MEEHPIQGLMKTAMENLKEMVDVNTIVGDPVETPDGSVILPVSKVGFGFAAGGSEFDVDDQSGVGGNGSPYGNNNNQGNKPKLPFGGGSGGGVSITPVAFLVVNASGIKMVHIDGQTHLYDRILEFAPQLVDKIQNLMNKNKKKTFDHKQTSADELGL